MTLKLVKDGEPDTSAEDAEMVARITANIVECVRLGTPFWVVTSVGQDFNIAFGGGRLEAATLAAGLAQRMAYDAVGLE